MFIFENSSSVIVLSNFRNKAHSHVKKISNFLSSFFSPEAHEKREQSSSFFPLHYVWQKMQKKIFRYYISQGHARLLKRLQPQKPFPPRVMNRDLTSSSVTTPKEKADLWWKLMMMARKHLQRSIKQMMLFSTCWCCCCNGNWVSS